MLRLHDRLLVKETPSLRFLPDLPNTCANQVLPKPQLPETQTINNPGSSCCLKFCDLPTASALTIAGVAALALGLGISTSAGARVNDGGLANNKAILDQLADVLPCNWNTQKAGWHADMHDAWNSHRQESD